MTIVEERDQYRKLLNEALPVLLGQFTRVCKLEKRIVELKAHHTPDPKKTDGLDKIPGTRIISSDTVKEIMDGWLLKDANNAIKHFISARKREKKREIIFYFVSFIAGAICFMFIQKLA